MCVCDVMMAGHVEPDEPPLQLSCFGVGAGGEGGMASSLRVINLIVSSSISSSNVLDTVMYDT